MSLGRIQHVLDEVLQERFRQEDKWGQQKHIDGTDRERFGPAADEQKRQVDAAARRGTLTYLQILLEEVYEAAAEPDPAKLRTELVQVAAVAVAWVECIDRRTRLQATATVAAVPIVYAGGVLDRATGPGTDGAS